MLIGRRLSGRYKILEVIGGGGMANVYLARDIILERDVAIKILRLDFSNDDELIKRFRREAHSATSLAHPNIVSIYDVGDEDDIYYIVMEYVAGKTLKQYIQKHAPLDPREALDIMMQLTSAISHAHQNQIVHRDIKPHNILVDPNGTVKVTDFGIAIALSSTTITQTNSVLGSVHYLSPEQARGGISTNKSDLYSLGIVLFELITGRVPFEGESAVSIALKHLQTETPSPKRWNPTVPQSVENIILKATAKDPFHRYETVDKMEEDIRTALRPERINEPKFTIPVDDEITKAIPIIRDEGTKLTESTIIRSDKSPEENVKKTDQKKTKKKKKKSKLITTLIILFFLIVAAGVAAVTIIPELFLPKEITVPDVTNMEYEKAYIELSDLGLIVNDPIEQDHEDIPEGYVIRTNPKAESVLKEGNSITIYESTGKKKFEFGDYKGRDYEEVKENLYNDGYLLVTSNPITNESAAGTIIGQSIREGEMVIPSETEINFDVSAGPPKILLKDLSGWPKKSVDDYTLEFELNIIEDAAFSEDVQEGLVISQEPKSGTEIKKKDTVKIVYSKGPEEKLPKTVTTTIEIPYEPNEEGLPQQVQIRIQDKDHSITDIYDSFEITESETREIEFVIPYGDKAKYLLFVNGKDIGSEEIPYPEDE